jgi:hypothetical protein
MTRAHHGNGADPLIRSVQVLAEHAHNFQADGPIFPQKPYQLFSTDEDYLRVVD